MNNISVTARPTISKRQRLGRDLWRDKWLYVMLIPGIVFFLLFKLKPFTWFAISIYEYNPFGDGPFSGDFVGVKYFKMLFSSSNFWKLLENTLLLSLYNIIFYFPLPILFALLLNEVNNMVYKKFVQTITYIPHFFSWVVIASISFSLFAVEDGAVNSLLEFLFGTKVQFLTSSEWLRPIVIIQQTWKDLGWGTIVYLAAMSSIDPALYEAASLDGAGRIQKMLHITLPSIAPTIATLLILRMGSFMDSSFDQLFLMVNNSNRAVGDVFDTYIYQQGIAGGKFSYTTAVGIFKSVVSLILVVSCNKIAKKLGNDGIM